MALHGKRFALQKDEVISGKEMGRDSGESWHARMPHVICRQHEAKRQTWCHKKFPRTGMVLSSGTGKVDDPPSINLFARPHHNARHKSQILAAVPFISASRFWYASYPSFAACCTVVLPSTISLHFCKIEDQSSKTVKGTFFLTQ